MCLMPSLVLDVQQASTTNRRDFQVNKNVYLSEVECC